MKNNTDNTEYLEGIQFAEATVCDYVTYHGELQGYAEICETFIKYIHHCQFTQQYFPESDIFNRGFSDYLFVHYPRLQDA